VSFALTAGPFRRLILNHIWRGWSRPAEAAICGKLAPWEVPMPELTEMHLEQQVELRMACEAELRAKYTQDERDKAAEKGEAMDGGKYPVKDEDDLKKSVKAVGRGNADHDVIRKFIMKRAKALGLSKLIPDNWAADGSLTEENSVWSTLEQRETYSDRESTVRTAIAESMPKDDDDDKDTIGYLWIADMTETWAVYEWEGELFQITYSLADDGVKLGKPEKVRRVTTYEANAADDNTENRNDPTPEDYGVMSALKDVKLTLANAKAKQLADPDNETDPDDKAVMAKIEEAEAAIDGAITAQSKDGHADARSETTGTETRAKEECTCGECEEGKHPDGSDCPECSGTGEIDGGPEQNGAKESPAKPREQRTAAAVAKEWRKAKVDLMKGMPERRWWQPTWGVPGMALRSAGDGGNIVEAFGCASVVERWYEVMDYEEIMVRGAFKRTLAEKPDVIFLLNHQGAPLARTTTDSLFLEEDQEGLQYNAHLQRHDPDVLSLLPKLERKDMDESSFAFRAREQEWDADYRKRRIPDALLHKGDVSVVNHGANDATSAGLGSEFKELSGALAELRSGKALSKDRERQIKELADKQKALSDELAGLLPGETEPAVEPADEGGAAAMVAANEPVPFRSAINLARARRARLTAGI
jgi:HK97 family phage prohead protease